MVYECEPAGRVTLCIGGGDRIANFYYIELQYEYTVLTSTQEARLEHIAAAAVVEEEALVDVHVFIGRLVVQRN